MEPSSDEKVEVNSGDKAKKKRSGWSAFYTFLASGGIIPLVIAIAVLAFVINLIINKLIK